MRSFSCILKGYIRFRYGLFRFVALPFFGVFPHPLIRRQTDDHRQQRSNGRGKAHWGQAGFIQCGSQIGKRQARANERDDVMQKRNARQTIRAKEAAEAEMNAREQAVPRITAQIFPAEPDDLRLPGESDTAPSAANASLRR